jgi:hypothetical protein
MVKTVVAVVAVVVMVALALEVKRGLVQVQDQIQAHLVGGR